MAATTVATARRVGIEEIVDVKQAVEAYHGLEHQRETYTGVVIDWQNG